MKANETRSSYENTWVSGNFGPPFVWNTVLGEFPKPHKLCKSKTIAIIHTAHHVFDAILCSVLSFKNSKSTVLPTSTSPITCLWINVLNKWIHPMHLIHVMPPQLIWLNILDRPNHPHSYMCLPTIWHMHAHSCAHKPPHDPPTSSHGVF